MKLVGELEADVSDALYQEGVINWQQQEIIGEKVHRN